MGRDGFGYELIPRFGFDGRFGGLKFPKWEATHKRRDKKKYPLGTRYLKDFDRANIHTCIYIYIYGNYMI